MDHNGSNKKLNFLLTVAFIIALLLIANVAAFIFLPHEVSHPYAVPGKDGKDAQVDYGLINDSVQQRVDAAVAALPKPQNGTNGKDGTDGVGAQGSKGDKGDKGDPAVVCRQIEIRQNPSTGAAEYRYVGDDIWQPTPETGVIQNSCEPKDGSDSGTI